MMFDADPWNGNSELATVWIRVFSSEQKTLESTIEKILYFLIGARQFYKMYMQRLFTRTSIEHVFLNIFDVAYPKMAGGYIVSYFCTGARTYQLLVVSWAVCMVLLERKVCLLVIYAYAVALTVSEI